MSNAPVTSPIEPQRDTLSLPVADRLTAALPLWSPDSTRRTHRAESLLVSVLPGEGIGPEVMAAAAEVLRVVEHHAPYRLDLHFGGLIGTAAEQAHGAALTPEVIDQCESTFARGGAVLCGPGGGRFVYDLRARFDLFCKLTPVRPFRALRDVGPLRAERVDGVDLVVVRENAGGMYFGESGCFTSPAGETVARHAFSYREDEVRRIVEVAARLAEQRGRRLTLALKPGAMLGVSELWLEVFNAVATGRDLEAAMLEMDNLCYQIIAAPRCFDVVVSPNLFGDILSDTAAVLLGSRGMSYSGNFGPQPGVAVYQTGHGAAYDLAGRDTANPIGQIMSTAMMLRESFGLSRLAASIEDAVERTLARGVRTVDIATADSTVVGTREMGRWIAKELARRLAEDDR